MKRQKKGIWIAVGLLIVFAAVIAALAASGVFSQSKNTPSAAQTAYKETGEMLAGTESAEVGSVGGEWMIIGLARSDRLSQEMANAHLQAADEYVAEIGSVRLHNAKCTDNARIILGVTAAGGDVTDVGGFDLLAGLTDMDYVTRQGNNGPIWTLIAIDSGNYEIPTDENASVQVNREALVAYILSVQCADGGWGLTGETSDVDMTAMALQSLAPYRDDKQVSAAIEAALEYLSQKQADDGGYESYGDSNSESCAQVIVALTALGIDPHTDSRFVKNGKSVLDAMCRFAISGGGFCHIASMPEVNGMATEQGYYALTAYYRFVEGKSALYDMSR